MKVLEEAKGLPKEQVCYAKRKLAGFKTLKIELDADMAKAQISLQALKLKIKANIHSDSNSDGFLTK